MILVLCAGACGGGPVEPAGPALELAVAGGDAQYGAPGQRLEAPLRVLVRRVDTGVPQAGIPVAWTVEAGSATLVTAAVGTTDSQGVAAATVQLGSTPGGVTVRAEVKDQPGARVTFHLFVADRPQLASVTPASARGGETVRIVGTGFSPAPAQNVVLFSGIRGTVLASSSSELTVRVPACLPARAVAVTVQLGSLVSAPASLTVSDGGLDTPFAAGTPVDVVDPQGLACLRLPGGRRYLVVVQSASTVGAATYGYALRGLASAVPTGGAAAPAPEALVHAALRSPALGVAERFEASLRISEDRLAREEGGRGALSGLLRAPAQPAVPEAGSRRTFRVLNAQGRFDDVRAVARLVGRHAILYVDEAAPGGGFSAGELAAFASTFDDVIHPTVTAAFGAVSDLDSNERVAILFTPAVNRLTPSGSDGFIGGFFYGLDLLDREGSNRGEVFYALVPDSAGQFSDVRPRDVVLRVIPAILAHEFQHMIHFNERVLKRGAPGTEALWLSEGLAQMAEELVARALEAAGDASAAEAYRLGNRIRARRYLADPGAVSLIVATGQGTLEERGAGWLYTLYLWDRGRGKDVLGRLTRTTLTGTANVASVTGRAWGDLLADWMAALAAEGPGDRYGFNYPSVSLRDLLRNQGPYPLSPETVGSSDFARSGLLWSSSARLYIVIPPPGGFVALRLGGEAGGNAPVEADLRLRVIPLL
jgi:hypothetical protein